MEPGEFGTRFGTGGARRAATGRTQWDEPERHCMLFVACCCTPQGREGLAGTAAPSYGSGGYEVVLVEAPLRALVPQYESIALPAPVT
jgi:hypothetical protein